MNVDLISLWPQGKRLGLHYTPVCGKLANFQPTVHSLKTQNGFSCESPLADGGRSISRLDRLGQLRMKAL